VFRFPGETATSESAALLDDEVVAHVLPRNVIVRKVGDRKDVHR